MSLYNIILVYVILWWITFFVLLPIGVQTDANPQAGNARGAPRQAQILQKLVAATLISIPLFFLVKWGIAVNLFGI
jgi:predicted secreted protein